VLRVRLEPAVSGTAPALRGGAAFMELALADDERLLDALDDQQQLRSALPSACRAGNCGACRVRVLAGDALLAAAAPREQVTLRELGAAEGERLGCQVHAAAGANGLVVLRIIAA
jgi:ferredoxin